MTLTRDEAIARLTEFHDHLEAAQRSGPATFLAALRECPPGMGVHEIDVDRVIRRVAPEELTLLGYREEEMVGQPVTGFIVMQEASQRAIDHKLKGTRELKPFLRTFRRGDGTALPLILLDRLVKDARGEVTGIRTVMMEARFHE